MWCPGWARASRRPRLGRLLKARGLKVAAQKLDPYINVDPGTMSPYQHGEVFVTDDGAETDLDLGHYERFIDEELNQLFQPHHGQGLLERAYNKERRGEYLGSTVQVIPHITDEIKDFIYAVGARTTDADVLITEIGGTIGDIEGQPFHRGHPPDRPARPGGRTASSSTSRWCPTCAARASTSPSPPSTR